MLSEEKVLPDLEEFASLKSETDRRRPDRDDVVSPHLIPLLRNPESITETDDDLLSNNHNEFAAVSGIITALLLSAPFWTLFVYFLL